MFVPRHVYKQIDDAGVAAIHDKLSISVSTPCVHILKDGYGLSPRLVICGNAFIPILVPDGACEDIESAVKTELLHHLFHRFSVEVVVGVVLCDGLFNGLFAGNVSLAGSSVLFQLPLLCGVVSGIRVDRQLPLCGQHGNGALFDTLAERVHVAGFQFLKRMINVLQRGG